jgi:nitrate reductase alpha subunit
LARAYNRCKKEDVIGLAIQFAQNAEKTGSMIITGAGMNHWYHMDMNYRYKIF